MMNRKSLLVYAAVVLSMTSSMASDLIIKEESDPGVIVFSERNITDDYENSSSAIVISNNQLVEFKEEISIVSAVSNMTHEELKYLDQHGSKIAGQHAKTFVEKNVYLGSEITKVTASIAKYIDPNADTLTEALADVIRSPLKLDENNYPETNAGVVGEKLHKAIKYLPYGGVISGGLRGFARTCLGTNTVSEGISNLVYGQAQPQVLEIKEEKEDTELRVVELTKEEAAEFEAQQKLEIKK